MHWKPCLRSFVCALSCLQVGTTIAAPDTEQLERGKVLFIKEWTAGDPASPKGDGLGPLFNARSCVACHRQGGVGGGGPNDRNAQLLTAIAPKEKLRDSERKKFRERLSVIHPEFSPQSRLRSTIVFHRFGTNVDYATFRQGIMGLVPPVGLTEARRARMLRAIQSRLDKAGQIKRIRFDNVNFLLSERNTPALFGTAQIDAIPMTALHDEVARQKQRSTSVTGRAPPGKFGWRGQTATFREFILGACAVELGLQVQGIPQFANPMNPEYIAPGDDMDAHQMTDLVAFTSHLPAPVQIIGSDPNLIRFGKSLFKTTGCIECHVEKMAEVDGIYSDLLLHDMGPELNDPSPAVPEKVMVGTRSVGGGGYFGSVDVDVFATLASNIKQEWRTPPLWGVASSAPYLHDGRAATLDEAIRFHGGEASSSRRDFGNLGLSDRAALIAFLKTLVGPPTAQAVPEDKPVK